MVNSQYVNWNDIENTVQIVSKKISKLSKNFSSISTISRGGLIPSRLLADSLGIEKIFVDQKTISSDSLFVDDIFDTGKTYSDIISKVSNSSEITFATLFVRRGMTLPEQLIYGQQTFDDSYVVFPWDKFEFEKTLK
ncbi:phosphoribosyltransferase [Nitrosopumilus sp. Nsub]|uniref:phosphoribosyltransferase n=1 Tax=Nitrosopumilus sp. Nsub TaxID=1776294 RepID=UPI000830D5AB|nr:phosphoribosyltransferase [Nitrosopumilus sp. Nsub]